MKVFLKKYWFEIILVLPMSLYILGFTIAPIFHRRVTADSRLVA